MSQDIVADALNQIMNAKRVEKTHLTINRYSKVLLNLFEMMKSKGHIEFTVDEESKKVNVDIIKLNECKAVKPRYYARATEIETYLRRFLPSRKFGTLAISTNKGMMSHRKAFANKIGGSIIAYFY